MKEPMRPENVPAEAVWSSEEREWQLGQHRVVGNKRKLKCPVGEWRYWRADGTLCCIANLDEEGRPHGLVERFHNDGTLASTGNWRAGHRFGHFVFIQSENSTDESYPASDETWRHEFDSTANWEENNLRWYLKDGTECTSVGRPLSEAYDLDTVIGAASPDEFLDKHADSVFTAIGEPKGELPAVDPLNLKRLWGITFPDIDKFIHTCTESNSFCRNTVLREFDGNMWLKLIEYPWGNMREELATIFMGAVKIGGFGDSDDICATLFRPKLDEPKPNAVYFWSHETYYIDDVLTRSLDDFAYRLAVAGSFDRERLSPMVARAAWRKLVGRTHVSWGGDEGLDTLTSDGYLPDDGTDTADGVAGDTADSVIGDAAHSVTGDTERGASDSVYGETVDESAFRVNLDPVNEVRGLFWRAQWIIELLAHDDARNFSDIKESFRANWNEPYDDADVDLLIKNAKERFPYTAIYLLWRFFWFNQHDRLTRCRNEFRDHFAPVVRDLVSLLDEICDQGRREIGKAIRNILAVRDDFLALGLEPESASTRAEERALREAEDEKRASEIADAVARDVENAVTREYDEKSVSFQGGLEEFLDRAWSNVNDKAVMPALEKIARTFPGFELQWRAYDWVRTGGYIRADQHLDSEAIGVGIWLGENGCKVIQPFIWSFVQTHDTTMIADLLLPAIGQTEGALDARLVKHCIGQLDIVEEYHFKRSLAIQLLVLMHQEQIVPRLCELIDEYFAEIGDKKDFDARLAAIPWETLLQTICQALLKFVKTDSPHAGTVCGALDKLLKHAVRNMDSKISASALDALVAWGETKVLPQVSAMLRLSDTPPQVAAFRAIESIAGKLTESEAREFATFHFRNPDDNDNAVTLMYHRAALALCAAFPDIGDADSITDSIELARELSTYGSDRWIEWHILECETVARFPELRLETIVGHLASENVQLRKAALAAYTTRGVTPPEYKPAFWPEVWAVENEPPAVLRLLSHPMYVDRAAPAAFFRENPSETAAPVLAKVVSRELDEFNTPGSGAYLPSEFTWLIRALVRHSQFDTTRDAIERCIKFPYQDVLSAVLQEIDQLPISFAPILIKVASDCQGWQQSSIAGWLTSKQQEPEVKQALTAAGLTTKKLKAWQ